MEFFRRPIVGYIVLTIGILLAVFTYTDHVNDKLRDGLASSCERVNILRAQSNISDAVSWKTTISILQREQRLAHTDNPATRIAHEKSATSLSNQASLLTVTAITNCDKAVNSPANYNFPNATKISAKNPTDMNPNVPKILSDSKKLLRSE